ncbi:MAG: phosphosulfolactate synthase [Bacillota bacterium]
MPRAWSPCLSYPEENRLEKPREIGWTMVIDKGAPLAETEGLLDAASDFIDLYKFGFGSTALYKDAFLRRKISLIKSYGVKPYCGGTLLEIAIMQHKVLPFLEQLHRYGLDYLEISDGTIPLSLTTRAMLIKSAVNDGFKVITEVGKKDPSNQLDAGDILNLIRHDLENGADKIILEGRESGKNIGIYNAAGIIIQAKLDELTGSGNLIQEKLIWEAPLKQQQEELIRRFGPNINLGNVPLTEVIPLESLRRGLRSDTLREKIKGEILY